MSDMFTALYEVWHGRQLEAVWRREIYPLAGFLMLLYGVFSAWLYYFFLSLRIPKTAVDTRFFWSYNGLMAFLFGLIALGVFKWNTTINGLPGSAMLFMLANMAYAFILSLVAGLAMKRYSTNASTIPF
ncbi:hypothetical protein L6Q79_07035 [bacterium]|nr:hypothetical protein [bacterium]NUN44684.1 hypothetical protein [bacterium]HMW32858.1 hypothetical protein [bacterium]HMW34755.1 hypothetical protein [bacterium]HMY36132.1 hypothetical protein [bacterium]